MDHRLKLNWARRHLDTLQASIERFVAGGAVHAMTLRFDADSGKYIATLRTQREFPSEWTLIVGDVMHNTRSALDALTYALSVRNLGRNPTGREARQIQFPIIDRPEDWNAERDRRLGCVTEEVQAAIEKLQPYNSAVAADPTFHHCLSIIRDISNVDKHRHILVAASAAADAGIVVTGPEIAPGSMLSGWSGIVVDGMEVASFDFRDASGELVPVERHPKLAVQGKVTLEFCFAGGAPGWGWPLMHMRGCVNYVEREVFSALEVFLS